jgi:hypothetical protein
VIRTGNEWLDGVDMAAAIRGSSRGFTVLVLGGLAAPAIAVLSGVLGTVVLTGSAVAAFVVAAMRPGTSTRPGLHGLLAAVGAYLMVLPLVLLAPMGRNPVQIGLTLVAAVCTGFAAGSVQSWRRSKKDAPGLAQVGGGRA